MGSFNIISNQIDVAGVVSQLMQLERQPVYLLEDRIASMQRKISAYQVVNTNLSSLAGSINKILYGSTSAPFITPATFNDRLASSIFTSRTATSSNESVLTAAASGTKTNGSYSIVVTQLAQAKTMVSAGFGLNDDLGPFNGSITMNGNNVTINLQAQGTEYTSETIYGAVGIAGKFTINANNGGTPTPLEINVTAGMTLTDIADEINLQASIAGISTATLEATVNSNKLVISSAATTANSFSIIYDESSDPGFADALGITQTQAAANNPTIRDLQEAINKADAGVFASIMYDGTDYRLMLTAKETGAINGNFSLGGDFMGPGNLDFDEAPGQDARDAELTVNGIAITSSSNTVKNVVEGVTLYLNNVSKITGYTNDPTPKPIYETTRLDVQVNNDEIVSAINEMISAYNAVTGYINYQFTYNTSTESSGVLAGDWTLRNVQSKLQSIISTGAMPVGSDYRSISQLGISYNKDGSLSLDESKLRAALDDNFDAVTQFFLGYEVSDGSGGTTKAGGVFTNLGEALKGLTDPLKSPIQNAMQGINSNISELQKTIASYELRLQAREDMLYAQFSAADEALRTMQVTMASLSSSLASLLQNNKNT